MTIFFYSLLKFSYNLVPCPCLHHMFWREGHKESNERYIYFFTCTNAWRKSLFLPTASFFTVYSSGGVTLCIVKLWTVLQPLYFFCTRREQGVLGEWVPTAEDPLSVTQIWANVIYVTDFTAYCPLNCERLQIGTVKICDPGLVYDRLRQSINL
jgi:hypothetical protein